MNTMEIKIVTVIFMPSGNYWVEFPDGDRETVEPQDTPDEWCDCIARAIMEGKKSVRIALKPDISAGFNDG